MPDFEFIEQSSPRYGPPAPVPIIQEEAEFSQLLDLYRERAPKRVLEIGVYAGGTLFHWLQNATPGTTVVGVDDCGYDNRHLYEDWYDPTQVSLVRVCGDTRDLDVRAQVAQHGLYDWMFIDAGHLDEEVRADWANYSLMTTRPAVVAFHDILEHEGLPRIQVFKLWAELKERYRYEEIIAEQPSSGIGVLYL